jgi:plasmid stabilization system protein ParE
MNAAIPLQWSARAVENLKHIEEYISLDSQMAAKKVAGEIISCAEIIGHFPFIGKAVDEFPHLGLRQMLKYSYRILYSVRDDSVNIVAIIHTKQNFTDMFLRR